MKKDCEKCIKNDRNHHAEDCIYCMKNNEKQYENNVSEKNKDKNN